MEEQGDLMDVMDLSPVGKKKLTRWIGQQTRKHNNICISKMIGYAPNEHKLMQMMKYIDAWHLAHPQETSQDDSGDLQEDIDEEEPVPAPEVKPKTPVFEQKVLSTKVKGKLNLLVLNHPDVHISEMIRNTADEAELLKVIEEIESRVVPVDIRVKLWTVRRL
ncbi:MAG: hypothetical protein A4E23_01717 [Methanomethylovorans sp. PtaU1.Bin073]|nr:MAG: hypothetical protein A4E23_01717 [Methanomethylovorans sp. PtaU1.Bin073]